jgi:hypothetical protein
MCWAVLHQTSQYFIQEMRSEIFLLISLSLSLPSISPSPLNPSFQPPLLQRILSSDINPQHASALMESMHNDVIKQDIKTEERHCFDVNRQMGGGGTDGA